MIKQTLSVVFLFLLVSFAQTGSVQAQKFGHVNSNELMQQMPEVVAAKEEMDKYGRQLEQQLRTLNQEFERKLQAYQENIETMSQAVRKDRERELQQLQERIESFRREAQDEISKKEQQLLEPIIRKVNRAIERVAKQHGYTYIFDTSTGAVLYADESDNVIALVRAELDL
jgi:outer membrane protein